jgi:hypothetical protein
MHGKEAFTENPQTLVLSVDVLETTSRTGGPTL